MARHHVTVCALHHLLHSSGSHKLVDGTSMVLWYYRLYDHFGV